MDTEATNLHRETHVDTRKPWMSPEIRDQSVKSLTAGKATPNPTEGGLTTGS